MSEKLREMATSQYLRALPITAKRGDIYDRNGILLAGSNTVYTIYARPNSVKDKKATAIQLSSILELDSSIINNILEKNVSEVKIKTKVPKDKALQIKSKDLSGIHVVESIDRVYPFGEFLTQILGFTNIDIRGQTGIESKYDNYLTGADGYIYTMTDVSGREISNTLPLSKAAIDGFNATLTIDYHIQAILENTVYKAHQSHNARAVSCVMMDVESGAILGIAETPSFDLNDIPRDDASKLLSLSRSKTISDVIEPGSTFKILTAAIGLDSGAITAHTTTNCPGYNIVDGVKIKCWRTLGHGHQTFAETVANSCNVAFMNIASRIGTEKLYSYFEKMGITAKTGIDLSGESSGIRIPATSVKNVDLARIGFGQSIALTALDLLVSSNIVINGGKSVVPYVLEYISDVNGNIKYRNYPQITNGIMKSDTSKIMINALEEVVLSGGGKNAAVSGYRVGGKTGTAQKYENGVIAQGKYISTFLGFAPVDNPKIICLMVVDEPTGAYYGSIVAAPYVGEIFREVLPYLGVIKNTVEIDKPVIIMPNLIGLRQYQVYSTMKELNIYYEVVGDGEYCKGQLPVPGEEITNDVIGLVSF
ncbi:MAG: stage V sporulation protein D [Christensenellaceae bacterium]|jgi:stage V sporulation protein D (sporulation-specific penicillin-binding protein)|nr:stage V sporulation protein D [Christensenellaceae bacterium]